MNPKALLCLGDRLLLMFLLPISLFISWKDKRKENRVSYPSSLIWVKYMIEWSEII